MVNRLHLSAVSSRRNHSKCFTTHQHLSIHADGRVTGSKLGFSVSLKDTLTCVFWHCSSKEDALSKKKTQTGARIHSLRSTLDLAFLSCHKAAVHWKHRTDFQLHVKLLTCARFPHSPQMCSAFLCWLLILPAICLLSQTIPHMERPTRCCGV